MSEKKAWVLLGFILVATMVPRAPLLHNAAADFNSDEAVDALVIKHLLEKGEVTLHNWDATYYGIVEGIMAIPLVWVLGLEPLAFKLAAIAGHLLLILAVFLLGKRLYGVVEALAAATVLVVFSTQLILWSSLASGGFVLVVAWGTFTLVGLYELRRSPSPGKTVVLGFFVGFGLYIYELYLVYVALLGACAFLASPWWAWLRPGGATRRARPCAGRSLVRWGGFLLGFVVGFGPRLALWIGGGLGSKKPGYALANLERLGDNADLLWSRCVPVFLGVNPLADTDLTRFIGPVWPFQAWLGIVGLLVFLTAWSSALYRCRHELGRALLLRPVRLGFEAQLVLLVPITALAFVLSSNPVDALSNRYLLPWLTSLPLLVGSWALRRQRGRWLVVGLVGLLLVVVPSVHATLWLVSHGYLTKDLRLADRPNDLAAVLAFLEERQISGAYGTYWQSYTATFLSGERILVAPFHDWDRYPAYTRYVDRLRNPAYIFRRGEPHHEFFLNRLASSGRPYESTELGRLLVYTSPRQERLLGPALAEPMPLTDHRAEIVALEAPVEGRVGEVLTIPLRITNRSDGTWSAWGAHFGSYRVAAAYHWFDDDGKVVVFDGERSILPSDVAPGDSITLIARVDPPPRPGRYDLLLTLVQEHVAWFDQATGSGVRYTVEIAESEP